MRTAKGLPCPLTESLDTTEWLNEEQRPWWHFARAQDDLNMGILRMFEGSFSFDATHPNESSVLIKYISLSQ